MVRLVLAEEHHLEHDAQELVKGAQATAGVVAAHAKAAASQRTSAS